MTFVVRNVRCVPSFQYTLLSVDQLWEEQRFDSQFNDVKSLILPDGKRASLPLPAWVRRISDLCLGPRLEFDKSRSVPFVNGPKLPTVSSSAPPLSTTPRGLCTFQPVSPTALQFQGGPAPPSQAPPPARRNSDSTVRQRPLY